MSRIIPSKYPSLDYELWNAIRSDGTQVNKRIAAAIAVKDKRVESHRSELWTKNGRTQLNFEGEEITGIPAIVDFIGLHPVFEALKTQIELNPEGIFEDIKSSLSSYKQWEIYFEETTMEQWLNINWAAFGHVIGAAVANQGAAEKYWNIQGKDALDSLRFWNDLDYSDPKVSKGDGLPLAKWNDIVQFWADRNYDPDSEIARAIDHPPSAPFRRCFNRIGEEVVMPNPLALGYRKMLYGVLSMNFGEEEPQELQKTYGKTILQKMLREQLVRAGKSGDFGPLILFIHSVCSHHLMRGNVSQQKIGLHLISMLGMRLQLRNVGALNVPDLAATLKTSFPFGPVLKILRDSKLISWNYFELTNVNAEVERLVGLL